MLAAGGVIDPLVGHVKSASDARSAQHFGRLQTWCIIAICICHTHAHTPHTMLGL